MASLSQLVPLPTTVAQVEALATRRVVEFALEIGITIAILKGDSNTIYRDLIDSDPSLALHGHLIHDVKQLACSFNCIRYAHVRRQGNSVAHALVKWAINSFGLTVWMEDVPLDILHIVQADLASFV